MRVRPHEDITAEALRRLDGPQCGPGRRADGSHYETHGVSFITYGGNGMFSSQYDLFDLAHQMRLCDELDAAGLLSPKLKAEWVQPVKQRLIDMLNKGAVA